MNKLTKLSWAIMIMMMVTLLITCKEEEDEPDPVLASFAFEPDVDNFLKVNFINASQNFSALAWDFGDNSAISTDENPSHIYAAVGTYTVKLTATSLDGKTTDDMSKVVTLTDPNAELTKLVGDVSKSWRLLRDVSTHRYPCEVGPEDYSTIWWAQGLNNDELANRPCLLNDTWTFGRDGSLVLDMAGDYWAEGGVFDPANICASTSSMLGPNGEDLSAWGGGNFTFVLNTTDMTLDAVGTGAYIGLCKLGNGTEVTVPQAHVLYNIVKLTDDAVDTLIVEGLYRWDPNQPGGYWRFVLVHYDDPNQEPPIPQPVPVAGFNMEINGNTVTFTNTTTNATSYEWDFGDGQTSTEENPVHTYANDGFFNISLTGINSNGSGTAVKPLFLSSNSPALTDALLQGPAWKIVVAEKTIFVGPTMGSSEWWAVPKNFLTGGGTGGDDWSCMVDDEFIFKTGGVYTYDGKGTVRNDGYFGTPNGCWNEADLTGNGAYFKSGDHTWAFTPASGGANAIITLTNGTDRAAFIGFYKGYYGGENTDGANPPNGGNPTNQYEVMGYAVGAAKEYLFVAVDLDGAGAGTSSWSVILER